MRDRDIFLEALKIVDLEQRAEYVQKACGNDAKLRAQVESQLRSHAMGMKDLENAAAGADSQYHTIVSKAGEINDQNDEARVSGEEEFCRYLQPTSRPGWLGRLGHYDIESILGRGAFGIVAKAFDSKLHRVVAIKMMSPDLALTSPPRKRFLREARMAAAVSHENIVAIYSVEEEPIPYIVMEYVPGQTLQQWMNNQGPLEVSTIVRVGKQIASGLAAAHAANLIHRDIKPSNILLCDGPLERVKISDFGLARAVDDASMTSSGMIVGTPLYMAPEQARGLSLDHRADLFSLGSLLYQLASGRPPFRAASTVAVLKRVCEDAPRKMEDILFGFPVWLEKIIFTLLEKKPADRYQSAQELVELLDRCERELERNGHVKQSTVEASHKVVSEPIPMSSHPVGPSKGHIPWTNPITWVVALAFLASIAFGLTRINWGDKPNKSIPLNATDLNKSPLPVEPDHSRTVAESILKLDGQISICVEQPGKPALWPENVSQLPEGNFEITSVMIRNSTNLSDRELLRLTGLKKLKRLDLLGSRNFSDVGLSIISSLASIESLELGFTSVTDKVVSELLKSSGLSDIGLGEVAIGDLAVEQLIRGLPNLKRFMVSSKASDECLKAVAASPKLTELSVKKSQLTSKGVSYLQKAAQLSEIQIVAADDSTVGLLAQLTQVDRISFNMCEATPAGLRPLLSRPGIKYLHIGDSPRIGDEHVATMIEYSQPLHLSLMNISITDRSIHLLAKVSHWKELEFQRTAITDAAISDLVRLTTLQRLNIRETKITIQGIESLKSALPNCYIETDFGNFGPQLVNRRMGLTHLPIAQARMRFF